MHSILLIDDEKMVLEGYQRQLRKSYHVVTASSGEEGLRKLASEGPFAVIVCDMCMPGIDGTQFFERTREDYPESIRIMLTGVSELPSAIDAVNRGYIFRYLTKPCGTESLLDALGKGIAEYEKTASERRKKEEELKLLSMAMAQSSDAVIITDSKGSIVYANHSAECITGYSCDEMMSRSPGIFSSGVHNRAFFQEMWKMLLDGMVWRGHIINRRKTGEIYEQDTIISPILDDSGQVINMVASGRDVTKERELEKRYNHAQKMEALGVLAGGIAHDFNNLLSPIIGYTEMALSEIPKESDMAGFLEEVYQAGMRARELVRQILAFSRWMDFKKEPVELHRITREVLKLIKAAVPSTIRIEQDIDQQSGLMLGDPGQMHQVIMNLATNAYHAMKKEGGLLSVSLMKVHIQETHCAGGTVLTEGDYLRLCVSDTGTGIPVDIMDKIFLPFYTTKKDGEGTGLGLSTVMNIITAHGGGIDVQSREGSGTQFCVYFPSVEREGDRESKVHESMLHGHERIMVVDDELTIAQMVGHMLTSLGYHAVVYTESMAALESLTASYKDFDLLITDLTMPELTGDRLACRVHEFSPSLPVILMTGHQEPEGTSPGASFAGIILKPIIWQKLADVVRKALDRQ